MYYAQKLKVAQPAEVEANLDELRKHEDYQEGLLQTEEQVIFMGTLDNKRARKKHLNNDQVVATKQRNPDYKGTVLYPEGRGDTWSYQKNQAFMLGVIEAGKSCHLITPVSEYDKEANTVTVDELLWLKDNQYQFTHLEDGTMMCTPPAQRPSSVVIRNYNVGANINIPASEISRAKNEILGRASATQSLSEPRPEGTYIPPSLRAKQALPQAKSKTIYAPPSFRAESSTKQVSRAPRSEGDYVPPSLRRRNAVNN